LLRADSADRGSGDSGYGPLSPAGCLSFVDGHASLLFVIACRHSAQTARPPATGSKARCSQQAQHVAISISPAGFASAVCGVLATYHSSIASFSAGVKSDPYCHSGVIDTEKPGYGAMKKKSSSAGSEP
jgi:hypothetical protein